MVIHSPTPSQWKALLAMDRHLLVHAGAGTGKTATVVLKILFELGVQIDGRRHASPLRLHEIAAITYTIQAAADLKRKLRAALFEAGREDEAFEVDASRIGTIHAFTHEILREFSLRVGRPFPGAVVDENESIALTSDAVRDAVLSAIETQSVDGIDDLLTVWSVKDVEGFVGKLVDESDRLRGLARRRAKLAPLERVLVDLSIGALELVETRLDARSGVDFDRMVVWTRDILAEHPDIRHALRRRIRLLIIDEFQDVDPPQQELAYLIGEPDSEAVATRLMLVGDPKQSIYRFRRADVTVWHDVQRDFETKNLGDVVLLEESFRSVPQILGFVDTAVGRILEEPIDGKERRNFEVEYHPIVTVRGEGSVDRAVEIHVVRPHEGDRAVTGDALRRIEADTVERRAMELHAEGVEWKDMAVLLRSWAPLDIYRSALRQAAIPSYALQTAGFFDRREVMDLILALETVRDPTDDRALFGFLRSPFVGLKDESLLWIARQAKRPFWRELGNIEIDEADLLRRAVALLKKYISLRDRIPTVDLLENIIYESGYLAHLALLGDDGEQRMANVKKVIRTIRGMRGASVGGVLKAFHKSKHLGVREGDAPLHGEADNVVTITTIHSAKGLEWDVVFWCDLARNVPTLTDRFLVARDEILLGDPERRSREQSREFQDLRKRLGDEELAETKRLWYVAATRAKDRLILPALPQGTFRGKTSPAAAIRRVVPELERPDLTHLEYHAADGATYVATVEYTPAPEGADITEDFVAASRAPEELSPLRAPIAVPVGRLRHSATEYLAHARCPKKHWFKYVQGIREPEVDRSGTEFISALARGLIVHDVLERLNEEDELDRILEDAIGRWDQDAPAPEGQEGRRYREHLTSEIQSVIHHPEYRRLVDHPSARRELGFFYVAARQVFAEGKIDLAAAPDEGVVLLDVKTSQVDAEAARKRASAYAPQRDVYVTAAEAIGDQPVSRFAFQFTRAAVQISDPVTDQQRSEAQKQFHRIGKKIGLGQPALTQYPHECRFCGYKKVGWCPGVEPVRSEK